MSVDAVPVLCIYDDAGVLMGMGVAPGSGWKALGPARFLWGRDR